VYGLPGAVELVMSLGNRYPGPLCRVGKFEPSVTNLCRTGLDPEARDLMISPAVGKVGGYYTTCAQ
jgi:hypothetical protein